MGVALQHKGPEQGWWLGKPGRRPAPGSSGQAQTTWGMTQGAQADTCLPLVHFRHAIEDLWCCRNTLRSADMGETVTSSL